MDDAGAPGIANTAADAAPDADPGLPINVVWSFDVVFRLGYALVREQPRFVLGAAAIVWVLQVAPTLLSLPLAMLAESQPRTTDGVQARLLLTFAQYGLSIALFPFAQLATVGISVAFAHYIATDEVRWRLIPTSLLPAVRTFAFKIVLGFAATVMTALFLTPATVALVYGIHRGPAAVAVVGALLVVAWGVANLWLMLTFVLGQYAAMLDGAWPPDALRAGWIAARGSRMTLLATAIALGVAGVLALAAYGCLLVPGIAAHVLLLAVVHGGTAASWLLYARPAAETARWPFFRRNPVGATGSGSARMA